MKKKNKKESTEIKAEEMAENSEQVSEQVQPEEQPKQAEQPEEKEPTEVEKLQQQIEELQKEVAVAKNAYYKAYADADNLKKRLQNEADTANRYRIQSFAINILPAVDALEMALAGKDNEDPFVKGVRLTYDSIMNALEKEGVTVVDCLNKEFDAKVANALISEKTEGVEPGIVVEVLQKGYMLKDRLLRAALVKVSE